MTDELANPSLKFRRADGTVVWFSQEFRPTSLEEPFTKGVLTVCGLPHTLEGVRELNRRLEEYHTENIAGWCDVHAGAGI